LIPLVNSEYDEHFWPKIANNLKKKGFNVLFITTTKYGDKCVIKNGFEFININDMVADFKDLDINKECLRLKNEYELGNLRKLYFSEKYREHFTSNDSELIIKTVNYLLAIEKVFNDYQVKFVVHHIGGEIIRRSFFLMGPKFGVKNVFIQFSPINWTSFFGTSLPILLDDVWMHEQISGEELLKIESYLKKFKAKKELMHINYYHSSGVLKKLFQNLKSKYGTYIRSDYNLFEAINITLSLIIRRCIFNKIYYPNIKKSLEICEKGKYFFFPIQYTRESRLTAYNPEYLNPDCFIKMIKEELPDGYKLLVKDHPHWVGDLPHKIIRNIHKMENVYFLNPNTSTHEIIEKSSAIITINSDVAYEALLYKKPVVTFGDEYFTGHGLTIDVDNIKNASKAFLKALEKDVIDNVQLLKFINMIFKNSHPGICWGSLETENIENLVNSLLKFCNLKANLND